MVAADLHTVLALPVAIVLPNPSCRLPRDCLHRSFPTPPEKLVCPPSGGCPGGICDRVGLLPKSVAVGTSPCPLFSCPCIATCSRVLRSGLRRPPLSPSSKIFIRKDTEPQRNSLMRVWGPHISSSIALFANNNSIVCHATFTLPASDSRQLRCGTVQGTAYNNEGGLIFNSHCRTRCLYTGSGYLPMLRDTLTEVWAISPKLVSSIDRLEAVHNPNPGFC